MIPGNEIQIHIQLNGCSSFEARQPKGGKFMIKLTKQLTN